MNARGWLVLVLAIVLLTTLCKAAEPVRLVVTLSCDDIRAIAQLTGWDELERGARAAGASPERIEQARKCLR